jgi:tetratricopeptide (TPR) repeat protein
MSWNTLAPVIVIAILALAATAAYRYARRGSTQTPLSPEQLQRIHDSGLEKLGTGDKLGAEEVIHTAVKQAAVQAGAGSPLYAQALFHEAIILVNVGDFSRAVEACRAAAAVPANDRASQKERLTYLMNLGDLLTRTGQLDEAERVLRDSLAERQAFYGLDHPGYAFGLTSLAELFLSKGQAREALVTIDQAVAINRASGHEKFPSDLALRGFAVKMVQGVESPAFETWADLSAE